MERLSLGSIPRVTDNDGSPLAGGQLHIFKAGTTERAETYSDVGLNTPNPNPVIANANGFFSPIYVRDGSYKVRITSPSGELIAEGDNLLHGATENRVYDFAKIGDIWFSGSNELLDGWLWAEGQQVSQTTYRDLFAKVAHRYAAGRTISTGRFYLPDLRGKVLRGAVDDADVGSSTDTPINIPALQGTTERHRHLYSVTATAHGNDVSRYNTEFVEGLNVTIPASTAPSKNIKLRGMIKALDGGSLGELSKGDKGDSGVSLTGRGNYSATERYDPNDFVYEETSGTTWIALTTNIGITPTDGANWMRMAEKGERGATGPAGPTGAPSTIPGPQGATGAQGIQGEKGDPGADGVDGQDGADSTVPGPQGIQGEKGDQGDMGDTGRSAYEQYKILFNQPDLTFAQYHERLKGGPGNDGATGPQGEKGEKGDTGAAGRDGTGTEGALGLEDLALVERLCGVSGADTDANSQHSASLILECDGGTPTEGKAILGGVIRFTSNSVFTGEFLFSYTNSAGNLINLFEFATQISGGNTGVQEWRLGGVEWDFSATGYKLSIPLDTFNPAENTLTYTFEGELAREGQAVGSVEAIVAKVRPPLSPSVLMSIKDVIPALRPGTGFEVTPSNSPRSTTPLTIVTSGLAGVETGDIVKFTFPFSFDTQPHQGFAPDCNLTITQGGNPIKVYSAEHGTGLAEQGDNQIEFYAPAGEDIILQPSVKLNTDEIPVTVYPFTGVIEAWDLGVLHDQALLLINQQIAIAKTEQAIINQGIQRNTDAVASLTENLTVLHAAFALTQERLSNPAYGVIDRAVVSAAEVGETVSRTARGDAFNAVINTGQNPYPQPIVFDLTTGAVTPSSSPSIPYVTVRDGGLYVNQLQPTVPASTRPGVVKNNGFTVDADNPLHINLGEGGHHLDTSLTLTPDPDNLPAANANFMVTFDAVVGGNDRETKTITLLWGDNIERSAVATNENGETVTVFAQQVGNAVRIRIVETGANSLPIDGGYLKLYATYVSLTPQVDAHVQDVKIADHTGHGVILLTTGAGAGSVLARVIVHYGDHQSIDTGRNANYIAFYTNNDSHIGNIYTVDFNAGGYDLTGLQQSAEGGDATLGFFGAPVLHETSELDLDTGLILTDKTAGKRNILEELDAVKDAKNDGGGGDATNPSPFGGFWKPRNFDVELTGNTAVNINTILPNNGRGLYVIGASGVIVSQGVGSTNPSLLLSSVGESSDEGGAFYNLTNNTRSLSVGAVVYTALDFNQLNGITPTDGTISVFGTAGGVRATLHCIEFCPPNLPTT